MTFQPVHAAIQDGLLTDLGMVCGAWGRQPGSPTAIAHGAKQANRIDAVLASSEMLRFTTDVQVMPFGAYDVHAELLVALCGEAPCTS